MVVENVGSDEPEGDPEQVEEVLQDITVEPEQRPGVLWDEVLQKYVPVTWQDIKVHADPPEDTESDMEDVGDGSTTVTAMEGPLDDMGDGSTTVTAMEGGSQETGEGGGIEELGQGVGDVSIEDEEDMIDPQETGGDDAQIQLQDPAEITVENLETWKTQTLACVTALQNKIKQVTKDNEGIKCLQQIRNMRVFEAKPQTQMPTLPTASLSRTHEPQYVGFPKTLKKKDTARTRKVERTPSGFQLVNEGLEKPYTDDVWGDLTHYPDADAIEHMLGLGYSAEDQVKFRDKLKKAFLYWECVECKTFNPEVFGDGTPQAGLYILCPSCEKWCHWRCSKLPAEAEETQKDNWKCTICASAGTSKSKSQRPKRSSKK